jgi:hypothetical protein
VVRWHQRILHRLVGRIDYRCGIWLALGDTWIGLPALFFAYTILALPPAISFKLPWQDGFQPWIRNPWFVVALFLWVPAMALLRVWINGGIEKLQKLGEFDRKQWIAILMALNEVVAGKAERFGEYAQFISPDTASGMIFQTITKPKEQIQLLSLQLQILIHSLMADDSLELVLVKIQNNKPILPIAHFPKSRGVPSPDLFGADADRTLFAHCARRKRYIVIPDIADHLKQRISKITYLPSGNPGEDRGSIVSYPLLHDHLNTVQYALSIKSDKVRAIDEDFVTHYQLVLDSFFQRMLLEASLEHIQGVIDGQ